MGTVRVRFAAHDAVDEFGVRDSGGDGVERRKNVRIPDSQVPSTTKACLTTAPCSKTRPTIIVSIARSADGFRDTNRDAHPADQAFRFL